VPSFEQLHLPRNPEHLHAQRLDFANKTRVKRVELTHGPPSLNLLLTGLVPPLSPTDCEVFGHRELSTRSAYVPNFSKLASKCALRSRPSVTDRDSQWERRRAHRLRVPGPIENGYPQTELGLA